jgi:hypothetical protein
MILFLSNSIIFRFELNLNIDKNVYPSYFDLACNTKLSTRATLLLINAFL